MRCDTMRSSWQFEDVVVDIHQPTDDGSRLAEASKLFPAFVADKTLVKAAMGSSPLPYGEVKFTLSRLNRLGADIAEAVLAAPTDGTGCRRALVPTESISHAARLLLSFVDDIEVLAPSALRNEVAARAVCALTPYHGDSGRSS
jgi:hypothetical protein